MAKRSVLAFLGIVLLTVVVSLVTNSVARPTTPDAPERQQTLYDKVIASGTIRCGYVTYPPGCIKDPNTGKMSGYFVDTLEEVAKGLDLKVEWVEEVGWGTMVEGLDAGRYDIIGSPVWPTSARGKVADFTAPLSYGVLDVYVPTSSDKFDGNIGAIDSADVKIATIDGEITDVLAKARFPKAQRVSLPQLSDVSQMLLNVSQGKADVTFVEPYIAYEFLANNPGAIRRITVDKPLFYSPNTMMFKRGEYEFKTMINTALQEVMGKGLVDDIINKYDPHGLIYRVDQPFRTAKALP